jgi:hypothetical protein
LDAAELEDAAADAPDPDSSETEIEANDGEDDTE